MKGVLQKNTQDEEMPQDAGDQNEASGAQDDGQNQDQESDSNVSPEEQDAYDRVVSAGMHILYDDQTHDGVMKMLQAGEKNPAQAMANVVTMMVTQLDEKSGGKIPEDIILPVTEEFLPMVAELADKAKIFTPDDRTMNLAMQQTVQMLGEQYGMNEADIKEAIGKLDQGEIQKIVSQQQQYQQGA